MGAAGADRGSGSHRLGLLAGAGVLLQAFLVAFGSSAGAAFSQSGEPQRAQEGPAYVPGQLVVGLEAWVPKTTVEEVLRPINDETGARTLDHIPGSGVALVALPPGLPVEEAERLYEAVYGVEVADPNYRLEPQATVPNDPAFGRLWGMNNTGQELRPATGTEAAVRGTPDADVDAPEAWGATTGNRDVVVAVIDSGVDIKHPDLKDNIWVNTDEIPANGVDDDNNGYKDDVNGWDFASSYEGDNTPYDPDPRTGVDASAEHGTHVAGIVGAKGNNGVGVAGVAGGVKIMPLKVGTSMYQAAASLRYAVANGATISNNSYGCPGAARGTNACLFSDNLENAIREANTAGHLFVAAAGNGDSARIGVDNDQALTFPASLDSPNVVSVAATDHNDALTSYSNYGATTVDLAAPGGTPEAGVYSTLPGGGYGFKNGTSMATPHVAGAAALVKSLRPGYDAVAIKDRLLKSVDEKAGMEGNTVTGGRLNVAKALGEPGAPLVVQTGPADGTGKVPEGANVSAVFSEPMDPATLGPGTFTLTGPVSTGHSGPVTASVSYDAASRRATLDPASGLAAGATYEARVGGGSPGAKDHAGDSRSADRVWALTVDPPPRVVATTPYPGETGARRYTKLEVFFSEDIDPGTLSSSDFTLRGNLTGASVPIYSISYDPAAKKATVYPYGSIEAGKGYMATVQGGRTYGVLDRTGNPLVQDGYGDRSFWRDDRYNWYFDG